MTGIAFLLADGTANARIKAFDLTSIPVTIPRWLMQIVPDPPYDSPDYRSTALRAPALPLVTVPAAALARALPAPPPGPSTLDLTGRGPLGERITVTGRLLDGDGRPIAGQRVEVWQANASGRYDHPVDQHPAPLDPNFSGGGVMVSGPDGSFALTTVKPGAYPWRNHSNAWRPAHIHFSVFGRAFTERLVTQMYFPGDPLLAFDPIFHSVRDEAARERLVSAFDWDTTVEEWSLGYRFDIVVGGRLGTPLEDPS